MLKKRIWSIISVCIVMGMLLSTTVFAADITPVDKTEEYVSAAEEKVIQDLLDQRAVILNEIFMNQGTGQNSRSISKLNMIDLELVRLGVTFLTGEQVAEQFPETKVRDATLWQGNSNNSRIDVPDSDVNSWTTYRTIYTSNGVTYNIQRLIAQPANSASRLADYGSRTITFNSNWTAGADNVLQVFAMSALDGALSQVPGASLVLTFFDAVNALVSGISTTTEVDVPNITYSWSNATTVAFSYVRLINETDDDQWLSLISNKTQTAVGYQIPRFNFVGENGAVVTTPEVIQGTRNINTTPSQYNSDSLAVSSYNSVTGGVRKCYVEYVQISGAESKSVQRIYPCIPEMPAFCE